MLHIQMNFFASRCGTGQHFLIRIALRGDEERGCILPLSASSLRCKNVR